jgi:hypothetical protein
MQGACQLGRAHLNVGGQESWPALAHDFHFIPEPDSGEFEAYQLVLGDADGKLPWEPGYDETIRDRQRALWEPVELAPAATV